ncbi:hypothetical protein BB558_006453, partial [Smittium angustum]
MFDLLSYQTISDIFIFSQNPNLALVSKTFYEVSQNTSVQARYFLFGPRKTDEQIADFYSKYKKLKLKEDLAVILTDKMDVELGWFHSIYRRTFQYCWAKCLKKMIGMYKLVIVDETENGTTVIEHHKVKKRKLNEKYDIRPVVNINFNAISGIFSFASKGGSLDFFKTLLEAHNIVIDTEKLYGIPASQMIGGSNLVKPYKDPIITNIPNNVYVLIMKEKNFEILKYIFEHEKPNQETTVKLLRSSIHSEILEIFEFVLQYCSIDILDKKTTISQLKFLNNLEFIKNVLGKYYKGDLSEKSIFDYIKPTMNSFYYHAGADNLDIIKFYVKNGIKPSNGKYKAVEEAIRSSSIETSKYFLSTVPIKKLSENTIIAGMKSYKPEHLKTLIDHGVDIDINSGTPLNYTCNRGFTESVNCLVENGADIYLDNSKALQKAAKNNYLDIVELILKNSNKPHDFIAKSFSKICISGNFSLANLYIKYNQVPKPSLDNALLKTLDNGFSILVELLIENGADYNVDRGKLLELAIVKEEKRIIDILLSKDDIIINTKSINQFMYGCKYNKLDLVDKFISRKSKVFLDNGSEGLIIALENGNKEISKVLIESVSDLDSICNKALVFACKNGYLDIVNKLCSNNKINVNMDEGIAYFYSVMDGYSEISAILIRAGLDKKYIEMGEIVEACKEGNIKKVREMVGSKNTDIAFQQDVCLKTACKRKNIEM